MSPEIAYQRINITLRCPEPDQVELVVTRDGIPALYRLTFEQTKLLAVQAVAALANWGVEP